MIVARELHLPPPAMSASIPLLDTIEPDEPSLSPTIASGNINAPKNARPSVVLTPTNHGSDPMATTQSDAESGS